MGNLKLELCLPFKWSVNYYLFLGFRCIRVHCPGATESATVRTDFVCSLCSSPLQEDMKFRVLGGRIYVILLLDLVVSYFCYIISKQNI